MHDAGLLNLDNNIAHNNIAANYLALVMWIFDVNIKYTWACHDQFWFFTNLVPIFHQFGTIRRYLPNCIARKEDSLNDSQAAIKQYI